MFNQVPVAKRTESLTELALSTLYANHPYLIIFQKEDWREYLHVLASIYDLLEEDRARIPFESLKSILVKFYSHKKIASVEQKVFQFFSMTISELGVLRDSHDQYGQRHIESTREGKELLQMVENLVRQKTKFSGTGAETLLGALNNILTNRQQFTEEQAIQHHKDLIKSYQKDIQRIAERGVEFAELLPLPHSNQALFNQAEEAAKHILSAIEDVKSAIERQRQGLAESYFEKSRSAGQSLNAVADFFSVLYQSPEYTSYIQSKDLLSFLDAYGGRFPVKNIDRLVHDIGRRELIERDQVQQSNLKIFANQFQRADLMIQEKIQSQLKVLQQQVNYAITTNVLTVQTQLSEILAQLFVRKEAALEFFEQKPVVIEFSSDFENGTLELFPFSVARDIEGVGLSFDQFGEAEERAIFEALVRAEEATLKNVLTKFQDLLTEKGRLQLSTYPYSQGLAEFYVLSEIELFDEQVWIEKLGLVDLSIPTKSGVFVLRQVQDIVFLKRGEDGAE